MYHLTIFRSTTTRLHVTLHLSITSIVLSHPAHLHPHPPNPERHAQDYVSFFGDGVRHTNSGRDVAVDRSLTVGGAVDPGRSEVGYWWHTVCRCDRLNIVFLRNRADSRLSDNQPRRIPLAKHTLPIITAIITDPTYSCTLPCCTPCPPRWWPCFLWPCFIPVFRISTPGKSPTRRTIIRLHSPHPDLNKHVSSSGFVSWVLELVLSLECLWICSSDRRCLCT